MSKTVKTSHNVYAAWNYEREIEDLNKASREGWQLLRGGCFSSKFKYNPDVCYRYQLDYQRGVEDLPRYIETFREQGWEYINSTFNGWSYFRKPYDPALPQEQYEIFTDRSSLQEMNSRWAKLAMCLCVLCAIPILGELALLLSTPKLPTLIQFLSLLLVMAVLVRGVVVMRDPDSHKDSRIDGVLIWVLFLAIVVGNGVSLGLMSARPWVETRFSAGWYDPIGQGEDAMCHATFHVAYPDNYYLDLEIDAASPVTITLYNNTEGENVYTVTESAFSEEDIRLKLKRGDYELVFTDFEGGKMNFACELN